MRKREVQRFSTTEARVVMLMAGRIAEHKYHGFDNARFDDDSGLEVLGWCAAYTTARKY